MLRIVEKLIRNTGKVFQTRAPDLSYQVVCCPMVTLSFIHLSLHHVTSSGTYYVVYLFELELAQFQSSFSFSNILKFVYFSFNCIRLHERLEINYIFYSCTFSSPQSELSFSCFRFERGLAIELVLFSIVSPMYTPNSN